MKHALAFLSLVAALIFAPSLTTPAVAQPCQWNYTQPGNVSTATYCGNVNVAGTISGNVTVACPDITIANCNAITVATIAGSGLTLEGHDWSTYSTLYSLGYNNKTDDGGGWFFKNGTSCTVNGITIFKDAGGNCWQRPNQNFLMLDWAGTGQSDDSAAIQAAFNLCATNRQVLYAGSHSYHVHHNLTLSYKCSLIGEAPQNNGQSGTQFNFNGNSDVGDCILVQGSTTPGGTQSGVPVGNFAIEGNAAASVCTNSGINFYMLQNTYAFNISVNDVQGAGLMFTGGVLNVLNNISIGNSGSVGHCMMEIDGGKIGGVEYVGTNLSIYDAQIGGAVTANPSSGICIDRYSRVLISGGSSENTGVAMSLCSKASSTYGVYSVTSTGFDYEQPSNGAQYMVQMGTGWIGSGNCVHGIDFIGNSFGSDNSSITASILAQSTDNFHAENNVFQSPNAGVTVFDFTNAATNIQLGVNDISQMNAPVYLKVSATAVDGAIASTPWNDTKNLPKTFAQIGSCSAALLGQTRFVTNSNSNVFGAVDAGGGSNQHWDTCNGTAWVVGGGG